MIGFPRISERCAAALLLLTQPLLLAYSASRDSPTWDEIAHLAAGIGHWVGGNFDLYSVNPPLVRLVAALPVLPASHGIDAAELSAVRARFLRPEFALGQRLFARASRDAFTWMMLARWGCIPFIVVGAFVCYRWARELYGGASGLFALALWCASPTVLAYGHLITPDAAAAGLGAAAGYSYWKWLRAPSWARAAVAGLALGFAALAKTTWIFLFPLWVFFWMLTRVGKHQSRSPSLATKHRAPSREVLQERANVRLGEPTKRVVPNALQLVVVILIAVDVINFGYAGEGSFQPLGRFRFVSATFGGGSREPRRFQGSVFEHVPVPLPSEFVHGIDLQCWDFERTMPSYLRGEWRDGGWWYYYLYALAIKEPLGTWGLLALSIGLAIFGRRSKTPMPSAVSAAGSLGQKTGDNSTTPSPPFDRSTSSRLTAGVPSTVPSTGSGKANGEGAEKADGTRSVPATLRAGECAEPTRYRASWRDELFLLAPAVVVMALVSSQTGFNHHVRYVLPCLPFLFISMSKVARCVEFKQWKIATFAGALLIWSIGSSLYYFPHSMSYFNELAGGPLGGHYHLGNSNIDWGQDLLFLQRWYEEHPEARPLHLAYDMPLIDPKTSAGVESVGVPAGPVMNRPGAAAARDWPWNIGIRNAPVEVSRYKDKSMGPQPGWFVVSVNQIHRRDGDLEYFLEFDPIATIGYSMYVYHITLGDANRVRRKLGMSELAAVTRDKELGTRDR
jgi:hypothetical protein